SLGRCPVKAAAFDTRMHAPAALTGRASKGVARLLRAHGFEVIAEPESFLVTKQDRLEPHETARAREWGTQLAASVGASPAQGPGSGAQPPASMPGHVSQAAHLGSPPRCRRNRNAGLLA